MNAVDVGGVAFLGRWTHQLSVLFAVLAAVVISVRNRGSQLKLEDLVSGCWAAAMLPTGIILVCCGFEPDLLPLVTGSNIHITTAGLTLVYLSLVKLRTFS